MRAGRSVGAERALEANRKHTRMIVLALVSLPGGLLASASNDRTVRVWEVETKCGKWRQSVGGGDIESRNKTTLVNKTIFLHTVQSSLRSCPSALSLNL